MRIILCQNDKNGIDSCSYIVFDGEFKPNISNINFEMSVLMISQ